MVGRKTRQETTFRPQSAISRGWTTPMCVSHFGAVFQDSDPVFGEKRSKAISATPRSRCIRREFREESQ